MSFRPKSKARPLAKGPHKFIHHPFSTAIMTVIQGLILNHFTLVRFIAWILLVLVLALRTTGIKKRFMSNTLMTSHHINREPTNLSGFYIDFKLKPFPHVRIFIGTFFKSYMLFELMAEFFYYRLNRHGAAISQSTYCSPPHLRASVKQSIYVFHSPLALLNHG